MNVIIFIIQSSSNRWTTPPPTYRPHAVAYTNRPTNQTRMQWHSQSTASKQHPASTQDNHFPTTVTMNQLLCLASKQTEVITAHRNMQETKAHTTRYVEIAQINQATDALSKEHISQQTRTSELKAAILEQRNIYNAVRCVPDTRERMTE